MNAIELDPIRATSAQGFLCGLGALEALHRQGIDAQLSWSSGPFPHAVVHGVASKEAMVEAVLADRDRRLQGSVLNYPVGAPFDQLSCDAEDLKDWVHELADDDPDLDLWSGLLVEGGYAGSGKAKPTHFDFTAGQKKFLKIVREIGQALDSHRVEEVLFGPWKYDGTFSTLGFEPEGERLQGLSGIPPAKDSILGVPGADWLAFLGLSFYPLATVQGRDRARVVTPACDSNWNRGAFRWPVWREPLGRATIAAVVTDPGLIAESPDRRKHGSQQLDSRGVPSIRESAIYRSAQGYGSFGPAKVIAQAGQPS